jgi:mannan endo-1,6-alpha-mannosidase
MCALAIFYVQLSKSAVALVTNSTGGTSEGNAAAGTGTQASDLTIITPATTADKAGAGIVTTLLLVGLLGGLGFMVTGV